MLVQWIRILCVRLVVVFASPRQHLIRAKFRPGYRNSFRRRLGGAAESLVTLVACQVISLPV